MEFGTELRKLRQSRGMSLSALGAAVYFTKGYLSKVENGRARPNRALAALCDRALGAEGELTALLGDPPPRRQHSGPPRR